MNVNTNISGKKPVPSVSPFSTCQPEGISTDTTGGTPIASAFIPTGTIKCCSNLSKGGRGTPAEH